MSRYDHMRKRFEDDTAEHEMTVLRDDDLYRHLRFMKPGSSFYYYDLVTWPGHLVICGDAGDYHFSRIRDMFEFFESDGDPINPDYWSEKLQGPGRGRDMSKSYSHEAFRAYLHDWAREEAEHNWDVEMYPDLLICAIEREVLYERTYSKEEALTRLRDFAEYELDEDPWEDAWEWDLTEFDHQYLWCCWAIVRGIEQYRKAMTPVAS